MKEIKIITIAVIITVAIMLSCACAMPACAEQDRGEFYPLLTMVVEKEQIGESGLWVITCRDKDGNLWAFYDDEGDWDIGDIANLLMWNVGECEEKNEIIEVYWEGYTEDIDSFFQMGDGAKRPLYTWMYYIQLRHLLFPFGSGNIYLFQGEGRQSRRGATHASP